MVSFWKYFESKKSYRVKPQNFPYFCSKVEEIENKNIKKR